MWHVICYVIVQSYIYTIRNQIDNKLMISGNKMILNYKNTNESDLG